MGDWSDKSAITNGIANLKNEQKTGIHVQPNGAVNHEIINGTGTLN